MIEIMGSLNKTILIDETKLSMVDSLSTYHNIYS